MKIFSLESNDNTDFLLHIRSKISEAAREVESAFHFLTGQPFEISGLDEAVNQPGVQYSKSLFVNWDNTLRHVIQPFKRADLRSNTANRAVS